MKRKLQKVIFISLILCLIFALSAQSATASVGTFSVTDSVRVRSEPSTEASVLTVVHPGETVEVLDHDPAGWSRVQAGGSTGFIRSDFLRAPTGSSSTTFRTTSGVNVRSEASTDSSVVATVTEGTSVEVTQHDPAGWSRVNVNGSSGFIRSDFLTRGGGSSGGAPAPAAPSETVIATLKTTGTVNLRAGASTDNDIIKSLTAGTSVEVLENLSGGWSRVRHSGSTGFIRSDLLSETGAPPAQPTSLLTTSTVNIRSGPSTNNSIVKTLNPNTSVEVLENQSNGWSRVRHSGSDGFIRSDLLSATGAPSGAVIGTLKTVTGVNLRSGPSTDHRIIEKLAVNTTVDILENQSSGWSRVRHKGTEGFIRSDLLGTGARAVELIDWATARSIIPRNTTLRVTDVRTGISYNVRGWAFGNHMDFDTATQADTDTKRSTRGGTWSWSARPVWITVGDRTFAAAVNGMPHAGSVTPGNGLSGHFCMHFRGSTSNGSTSASYVRNMQNAITEAYNARPNQ